MSPASERRRCRQCNYRYPRGKRQYCDICIRQRRRRQAHDRHLKATYQITIGEYDEMLAAQNGGCAICGGGTSKRHFAVDHDHKTGEVRGLACATCNKVLAMFRDDAGRFDKAASYLRNPPARGVLAARDWQGNIQ